MIRFQPAISRLAPALALGIVLTVVLTSVLSVPAWAQRGGTTYAIRGATVHTLAGPVIENGTVVIRNGKIAAVGASVRVPRNARTIDAKGLHVYPGLFDSFGQLGLQEVSSVPATMDTTEMGNYKPQLNAYTAIHPPSEHFPVVRANGVTHSVSAPGGGVMAGQATLIHHDGWTVEEMVIEKSIGLVVNWPALGFGGRRFGGRGRGGARQSFADRKKQYDERITELSEWIEAARHYAQVTQAGSAGNYERNLKLEALIPVIEGKLPVIVRVNGNREIKDAVKFAEEHKLKLILAGGREAWKVKDLLKEKNIPVILGTTLSSARGEDQAYDKPFTIPGELHAAGIKIAFASQGIGSQGIPRSLPYEAANAVPYGLPWEEAIKAITLYPAQILGVDDRLGSIEAGKIANLIVTTGDPLEITTEVRYLFINGKQTSTDNKHRRLYEKYRARP